tara:strand:- start:9317 stop:9637 length:321 start_codon:yes stop_codon:yes gene_type:complete
MSRKHELQEHTSQEGKNLQLGQAGYVHLKTSGSLLLHSDVGHYCAVTVLEDECEVSVQLGGSAHTDSMDGLAAVPVPAGTTLHGAWTRVSIRRSGTTDTSAIIYKG